MTYTQKTVPIGKLHPNTGQVQGLPKNPRFIRDERFEALKKSIADFPDMLNLREIIAYDNGGQLVIVAGNMRYRAMEALGYKEAPAKILSQDTPPDVLRQIAIKDNVAFGQDDFDLLANQWEMEELEAWGFELPADLREQPAEEADPKAEDDNFDPELEPVQTMCKRGEVWQLGHHRLMCGDSTKPADVQQLMAGQLADLLVTDPPYGVDYSSKNEMLNKRDGAKRNTNPIAADAKDDKELFEFLQKAFGNAAASMKPGAAFYIWYAFKRADVFDRAITASGLRLAQQLIWVKNNIVIGRMDYQYRHEPCLYGWKEGAGHYFIAERTHQSIIVDMAKADPSKMKADELRELLQRILDTAQLPDTVLYHKKPQASAEHPTMKPVTLMADNIRNSSKQGGRVLDLFGGSGTTLIACEQMGRVCHMMEYEPHYCDIIIARWEKLTEGKAVKISG